MPREGGAVYEGGKLMSRASFNPCHLSSQEKNSVGGKDEAKDTCTWANFAALEI